MKWQKVKFEIDENAGPVRQAFQWVFVLGGIAFGIYTFLCIAVGIIRWSWIGGD